MRGKAYVLGFAATVLGAVVVSLYLAWAVPEEGLATVSTPRTLCADLERECDPEDAGPRDPVVVFEQARKALGTRDGKLLGAKLRYTDGTLTYLSYEYAALREGAPVRAEVRVAAFGESSVDFDYTVSDVPQGEGPPSGPAPDVIFRAIPLLGGPEALAAALEAGGSREVTLEYRRGDPFAVEASMAYPVLVATPGGGFERARPPAEPVEADLLVLTAEDAFGVFVLAPPPAAQAE